MRAISRRGMAPQGTYSPAPSGAFFIAASRGAHARCDLDQHKRALTSDVRAMLASGAAIKRYARSPVSPNALSNVLRRLPVGDGASHATSPAALCSGLFLRPAHDSPNANTGRLGSG